MACMQHPEEHVQRARGHWLLLEGFRMRCAMRCSPSRQSRISSSRIYEGSLIFTQTCSASHTLSWLRHRKEAGMLRSNYKNRTCPSSLSFANDKQSSCAVVCQMECQRELLDIVGTMCSQQPHPLQSCLHTQRAWGFLQIGYPSLDGFTGKTKNNQLPAEIGPDPILRNTARAMSMPHGSWSPC